MNQDLNNSILDSFFRGKLQKELRLDLHKVDYKLFFQKFQRDDPFSLYSLGSFKRELNSPNGSISICNFMPIQCVVSGSFVCLFDNF